MSNKRGSYKSKIPYDEIIAKYQTGEYSLGKLSKMYGVGKSTLSEYISKHKLSKSEHAPNAILSLSKGFQELASVKSEQKSEHEKELIVNEVLEIVKKKSPMFAKTLQVLGSQLLNKSFEMLENSKSTSDLTNIANVMQKVNDTLQVIPKQPTQAQQINIHNQNANILGNSQSTNTKELPPLKIVNINNKEELEKAREIIHGEIIE